MRLRFLAAALLLAAGCENLPVILPPGFGGGQTPQKDSQFFFPTGVAVTADKTVLVANGNFGHAFAGGSMVSLDSTYIDGLFNRTSAPADGGPAIDCSHPAILPDGGFAFNDGGVNIDDGGTVGGLVPVFPPDCDVPENQIQFHSGVMIGNYAGPIALNDTGDTAYVGARDSNTVDAVHVAPGGDLSCAADAGVGVDCRPGVLNTVASVNQDGTNTAANLEGPFAIVPGDAALPGQPSQRVMFVGSLIPYVNAIQDGIPITSSMVSALPQSNPTKPLFTMLASSQFGGGSGGGIGGGISSMLYDGVRRRLIVGGCYERFGGTGSGEPATSKCANLNFNFLRFLSVDSGAVAQVSSFDIFTDVQSLDLSSMAFADPDPATGAPTTLWATMRQPDVLAKVALSLDPSVPPRVRLIVPLPSRPAQVVVVPRPGVGNIVVVTAEETGAITVYDDSVQQVVANVDRVGDQPYGLALYDLTPTAARLVSSVFAGCSLALVEIPLANPAGAALRARIGGCIE
jgi:hypothetical protein